MRLALVAILVAGCGGGTAADTRTLATKIVAAPDRIDKDKQKDAQRKPVETLVFIGARPGMRVAELGAGGGYTTELLARTVGPSGAVIAQDTPNWDSPGLKKVWEMRLARPGFEHTTHVMRQWDDPLPPEAKGLDAVVIFATYHDAIAEKGDTNKLNQAVFAALKPGGAYIVVDNSAQAGSGARDCEPLHRVDEQLVRDEVQRAGFKLAAENDYLRNPADTRDWNADPGADARSHTQDLFALKFVRP
jgi:predicted methyltransferase